MRISDWSSDVCSSDLVEVVTRHVRQTPAPAIGREIGLFIGYAERGGVAPAEARDDVRRHPIHHRMIGEVRAQPAHRARTGFRHDPSSGARAGIARAMGTSGGRDFLRQEPGVLRSEEHTSELQSLMRISYAVFCWK